MDNARMSKVHKDLANLQALASLALPNPSSYEILALYPSNPSYSLASYLPTYIPLTLAMALLMLA